MKHVLFAEDHAIVVKGIRIMFETEIPGYELVTVITSVDLMKALKAGGYELLILDLQLEDGNVMHLITDIVKLYPQLKILVFSANPEEIYAQKLYHEGIIGYLSKQSSDAEIIHAISDALNGKVYISEKFKRHLFANPSQDIKVMPLQQLSSRELQVANLLQQGKRPSEICQELNLQSSTVATYKMKIFTKLNITNVIELKQLFMNYKMA